MSQAELDNLVCIGQLTTEPRNALEVSRMLAIAGALAALRWRVLDVAHQA